MLNPSELFDLHAYMAKLSPDLGYAILTATIVEEQLEVLLLLTHALDDDKAEELFGKYGKYQSFANKITGAHEAGLIDDDTRDDLIIIKDIRNEFAHTRERLDFKAPRIKALAETFRDHAPEFDVRQVFDERVERVINAIMAKTGVIIFAQATA